MRQETGSSRAPQFRCSKIGAAIALALAVVTPSAFAFEFKSGEVTGSFDTTVSAGALWRIQSRDPTLVSITNGGTDTDTFHEIKVDGEWRFTVSSAQDIIDGTC